MSHILVVDDEEAVCWALRRALTGDGHGVDVAASAEEVSGNAERAADVARHSVEVAHKGGDAVRRTIDGMNTIRETIQETSKRIKRLVAGAFTRDGGLIRIGDQENRPTCCAC